LWSLKQDLKRNVVSVAVIALNAMVVMELAPKTRLSNWAKETGMNSTTIYVRVAVFVMSNVLAMP